MGMNDSRFKSWVRFLLSDLKEIEAEKDENIRAQKLAEIIDKLQKTLED